MNSQEATNMVYIGISQIKKEILNFIRSSDVFTTSARGVTRTTQQFSGDNSETDFVLSQGSATKNTVTVTVDSVTLTYGKDYTLDLSTGTITFATAPSLATSNVSVQYDYGSSDKIFPDFPQAYLKIGQFPRIGFDIITGKPEKNGCGEVSIRTPYTITINCYSESTETTDDLISTVKEKINANAKNFYYFQQIYPSAIGPTLCPPFGENKIFQRTIDFDLLVVNEQ